MTGKRSTGKKPSDRERLLSKAVIDIETGCWNWKGARNERGYGRALLGGRNIMAHRAVYQVVEGLIPEGLVLDHLCRNHGCVNPAHLEPVTSAENQRRSPFFMGTHCGAGHEFTDENTRWKRGQRICKTCHRDTNSKSYHRVRDQDPERIKARSRAYYEAHSEEIKAYQRRHAASKKSASQRDSNVLFEPETEPGPTGSP